MIELRLVAREGDYLVLESQAGERFRVMVEDSLREATRLSAKAVSGTSPKEIQALIRAGFTASEVAKQTGESEEYVALFAGAVLDELKFVLDSAMSVTLSDGQAMVPFAELVSRSQAVERWQLAKTDGRWVVTAQTASGPAQWAFSPSDLTLEPMNSLARNVAAEPTARPSRANTTPVVVSTATASQPETAAESPTREASDSERPAASVLDLVSEIRRREVDSPKAVEAVVEPDSNDAAQPETANTKPASAKGRASLPSWDEIVSGTSHPDEEF
jgi:hypothetical protein